MSRVNQIQLMNALNYEANGGSLMYMQVLIGIDDTLVINDTGATNSLVAGRVAERVGLEVDMTYA